MCIRDRYGVGQARCSSFQVAHVAQDLSGSGIRSIDGAPCAANVVSIARATMRIGLMGMWNGARLTVIERRKTIRCIERRLHGTRDLTLRLHCLLYTSDAA